MERDMMLSRQYLRQLSDMYELLSPEERLSPRNLYLYQPARAALDTLYGDGRMHRDIAAVFSAARENLRAEELTDGFYMMALADTLENMNIQLYEHYRVLADLLLEAARRVLPSEDPQALYSLLKGARLGLLDPEKYVPDAVKAVDKLTETPENADFIRLARDESGRWTKP